MKIFVTNKWREVGKPYFKKTTSLQFITYNTKTNDIYDGSLLNYHKKRAFTKTLRRNQFWRQPFGRIMDLLRGVYFRSIERESIPNEIDKLINLFLDNIPNLKKNFLLSYDEMLFKTRSDIMGVKLPDKLASV